MRSQPIKLSELAGLVQKAIAGPFEGKLFWVLADVSNYSYYAQKGHHYFDLVEKSRTGVDIIAKLQTAAWQTGNESIKRFERATGQKFKNDIQALAQVAVDFHPIYGLKLVLQDIDASYTIGVLEQQRQQTIQALINEKFISVIAERYITDNNQLSLPLVLQRIAVVSAAESAGLQDFLHTLENNSFGYRFDTDPYYIPVQNATNAAIVYNKLVEVFTSGLPYDAVVMIRGGGSQSDFLLFDQLPLGKIVAKFPIPVITGIGHQKNETIVDLVAHTSTKTPTKAAEFIIAHNHGFEMNLGRSENLLIIKAQQLLAVEKERMSETKQLVIQQAKEMIFHHRSGLVEANMSLWNQTSSYLKQKSHSLTATENLLKVFSPENILRKGFAIVKMNGAIIADATKINPGDHVSVLLSGYEIDTIVETKIKLNGNEFDL